MILNPRSYLASVFIMVLLLTTIIGCGPRQQVRANYNEYHSRIEHILPENEACLAWAPMLKLLRDHEEYNRELLIASIREYNAMHAAGRISYQQHQAMVAPFQQREYESNMRATADLVHRTGWTYDGVQYCKGYTTGSEDPSLCWGAEHIWNDDSVGDFTRPSSLGFVGYCLDNDFNR